MIAIGFKSDSSAQPIFTPVEGSFQLSSFVSDLFVHFSFKFSRDPLNGDFFQIGHNVGMPKDNLFHFTI